MKDVPELTESQIEEAQKAIKEALKKVESDMKEWREASRVDPIKMITPISRL